jgi:hypothetical protein
MAPRATTSAGPKTTGWRWAAGSSPPATRWACRTAARPSRPAASAWPAALGPQAEVWPRLDLGALTDRLAACTGVVGVDSGLSHIAVALDLPHVQLYNFDTAWRTGPHGMPWPAQRVRPTRTRCGRRLAGLAAGVRAMIRALYSC